VRRGCIDGQQFRGTVGAEVARAFELRHVIKIM
jgi:hypothetical protein